MTNISNKKRPTIEHLFNCWSFISFQLAVFSSHNPNCQLQAVNCKQDYPFIIEWPILSLLVVK